MVILAIWAVLQNPFFKKYLQFCLEDLTPWISSNILVETDFDFWDLLFNSPLLSFFFFHVGPVFLFCTFISLTTKKFLFDFIMFSVAINRYVATKVPPQFHLILAIGWRLTLWSLCLGWSVAVIDVGELIHAFVLHSAGFSTLWVGDPGPSSISIPSDIATPSDDGGFLLHELGGLDNPASPGAVQILVDPTLFETPPGQDSMVAPRDEQEREQYNQIMAELEEFTNIPAAAAPAAQVTQEGGSSAVPPQPSRQELDNTIDTKRRRMIDLLSDACDAAEGRTEAETNKARTLGDPFFDNHYEGQIEHYQDKENTAIKEFYKEVAEHRKISKRRKLSDE